MGAPLQARVDSFEARARRFVTRSDVPAAVQQALEALLLDPTSEVALASLHARRAQLASDPTLRADAILAALVANDAAAPSGSNAAVLALLARARVWLPHDPVVPWVEALVVPERGNRRALLEEAFAKGARDPALLLALARSALSAGDADATLAALDALPIATEDTAAEPLGAALRERAEAVQRARAALRHTAIDGVVVWTPPSLPEDTAVQLARAVRADLDEAASLLRGPSRPHLVVWAHATLDDFRVSTCGTSWSQAFYDGVLHVVLVGDTLDDTLLRSARHESLHAQLGYLSPLAPRWLHEGLAQRFAREPFEAPAAGLGALGSADVRAIDQDLGLGNDGPTAGAAYVRARLAVEQLAARAGDGVFAEAVALLRAGAPASSLPDRLGFTH